MTPEKTKIITFGSAACGIVPVVEKKPGQADNRSREHRSMSPHDVAPCAFAILKHSPRSNCALFTPCTKCMLSSLQFIARLNLSFSIVKNNQQFRGLAGNRFDFF